MILSRKWLPIGAAVLGASAVLAVPSNASACPSGGCLGSPPACPPNTNCITVNDPNYGDQGNSEWCTLDDAVNSFEGGYLVDGCTWTGGASAFAVLLPGTQNGHSGVQYGEPEGLGIASSYNGLGIQVIGAWAANSANSSTILVGGYDFQSPVQLSGGSSLVNLTVTAWTGTFSQYFSPGNCVYIDGTASLLGVTIQNCFGDVNNPYGIQGVPALLVGPGANATVTNSTITNNSGGGIQVNALGQDSVPSLSIVASVISHNTSQSEGAGIAVYGGYIDTIQDSLIEYNVTTSGSGGGISVDTDPQNPTNYGQIGAITHSGIVYNKAPSGGGVALVNGWIGSAQVSGIDWCTIAYNQATGGLGGGVFIGSSSTNLFYARHDTVAENTATASAGGGGVYAYPGQVEWDGSIFADNKSNNVADDFEGQLRQPNFECWTDGLDSNQIQTLAKTHPTGWQTKSSAGCSPGNTEVQDVNSNAAFSSTTLSWSAGAWTSTRNTPPLPAVPSLPYFPMKANPPGGMTYFYEVVTTYDDELDHPAAHTGSKGYYVIGSIEQK